MLDKNEFIMKGVVLQADAFLPEKTFANPPLDSTIGSPMMNADATVTHVIAIPTHNPQNPKSKTYPEKYKGIGQNMITIKVSKPPPLRLNLKAFFSCTSSCSRFCASATASVDMSSVTSDKCSGQCLCTSQVMCQTNDYTD